MILNSDVRMKADLWNRTGELTGVEVEGMGGASSGDCEEDFIGIRSQ